MNHRAHKYKKLASEWALYFIALGVLISIMATLVSAARAETVIPATVEPIPYALSISFGPGTILGPGTVIDRRPCTLDGGEF